MGAQCQTCTREIEYNIVDSDTLFKEISQTDLGKDVQRLKVDNQQYLKAYKTVPLVDGSYYRGKLVEGKKEGYGELYCQGFNYFGFFKNDLPHGIGAIVTETQCQYGQFEGGVINGQGKEWNKKYRYEGKYRKGERVQGNIYREELTYTGTFENNLYHGKGTLNLKDGTNYQGSFEHGKFNGKGKLSFINGNSYIGQFKNGVFDGYGEFTWSNGNTYKGLYTEGQRNGYGVLTVDKVEYAGGWKKGVREGRGFLVHGSDQVFGDWSENLLIEK